MGPQGRRSQAELVGTGVCTSITYWRNVRFVRAYGALQMRNELDESSQTAIVGSALQFAT